MDNKKYYIIGGILALLLILAGVLFFTSGPKTSNNLNGAASITWWMTYEEYANVQDLIQDYTKNHKGTTINFVKKNAAEYEQELINAIAAGTGPDIFSIHNDWLPKHIDKLAPAPDYLNPRVYKDTFVDVASADFVKDNKVYAIPLSTDILALYYNKDMLNSAGIAQPPVTWPELVADVEKITKISSPGNFSRSGIALGTSDNVNRAVDVLALLMLQNGTKFYSDDLNQATFDQQAQSVDSQAFNPGASALAFYVQFADPAKLSYTWNSKADFSIDAFTQGKVAMMLNYAYSQPVIRAKAPNLNWDVAAVPQISEDANKINFANYWGLTVSKSSKVPNNAWDFLNFISGKAELTKYYAKHKLVASRKDMLPDQFSDNDIGVFAENALTARSIYKKDTNVFEAVFLRLIDDVILHDFKPEDALRNAVSQINLSLQQ